jgi:hypothetical protein
LRCHLHCLGVEIIERVVNDDPWPSVALGNAAERADTDDLHELLVFNDFVDGEYDPKSFLDEVQKFVLEEFLVVICGAMGASSEG